MRIPERFNNPFETQFMAPQEVEGEFLRANPWMRPEMFVVGCSGPGNRLRDVRICLTRDGQGRTCGDNENPRKLCRADQMHVPPVRSTRREGVAKKKTRCSPSAIAACRALGCWKLQRPSRRPPRPATAILWTSTQAPRPSQCRRLVGRPAGSADLLA